MVGQLPVDPVAYRRARLPTISAHKLGAMSALRRELHSLPR